MSLFDRIENDFTYHAPTANKVVRFADIRQLAKSLAHLIDDLVPDGREKSLALSKLEEVVMWSNAGIAREVDGG